MANNLGSNPMVIDTAGEAVLRNTPTLIKKLSWQNYTEAAHTISVTDADDIPLLQSTGDADLSPIELDFGDLGQPAFGLKVPTLGSGKLLVFLR
jgi:hypothetical protein